MNGDTIVWPTSPSRFKFQSLHFGKTDEGFFYAANAFCVPEHAGTHLDAPLHFSETGESVDRISVRRLLAPAIVVDVTKEVAADPDYALTLVDLQRWEKRHGPVPRGSVVLLRTGWSSRYADAKRYLGEDTPGDCEHLLFPSFGPDAAELLTKIRGVAGIGVDSASLDRGQSKEFAVHRVVLEAGAFGLENLTNLSALPEVGAWIAALPLAITNGSGSPVRVVGLLMP
jgi:kynurenine formamidase